MFEGDVSAIVPTVGITSNGRVQLYFLDGVTIADDSSGDSYKWGDCSGFSSVVKVFFLGDATVEGNIYNSKNDTRAKR